MLSCPHCRTHLDRETSPIGVFWRCASCEGRLFTLSLLRKKLRADYVNQVWRNARAGETTETDVPCPMCRNAMREVATPPAAEDHGSIHLDVCTSCHTVWFDVHEIEAARGTAALPPPPVERDLPDKAKLILAMARIEQLRREHTADELVDGTPPRDFWSTVITLFGVPVEVDRAPLSRIPWVTIAAISAMVAVSGWVWFVNPDLLQTWGLLPTDPFRYAGITFLTAAFIHADAFHLIGNSLFLAVFGVKLEDRFGHFGMAALLLVATIVGFLVHILGDPRSTVLCVGASGSVSGVVTLHVLLFPSAIFVTFFRLGIFFRWIRFRAIWGFAIWLVWQAILVHSQLSGHGSVSGLAHAGGIAVGVLAWWRLCRSSREAA